MTRLPPMRQLRFYTRIALVAVRVGRIELALIATSHARDAIARLQEHRA